MIEIDGSQGEGGGQILRTALSLSACTGQGIHIRNIRAGRKKPGLMRQHLACVEAISHICRGEVHGAHIGSLELRFSPDQVQAGDYHFVIGSAGSSMLVFQTVLMPLLLTGKSSSLCFEGGTHNPMAPCYDFLKEVFLPQLERMGLDYTMQIERYGFYPVGGGKWRITINPPSRFRPLLIEQRGAYAGLSARCISSGIPKHIVQREQTKLLKLSGWAADQITTEHVPSIGRGNVVLVKAAYEYTSELVDSIGKLGVPAETVAADAFKKMRRYQRSRVPVGSYLADQLLLPMALTAGGHFVTGPLSLHCETNIAVINRLLGVEIKVISGGQGDEYRVLVPC